jgi:hypothetical protein
MKDGTRCNGLISLNDKKTKWTCLVKYDKGKLLSPPCKVPISLYKGSFFERIRSGQLRPEQVMLVARHLLEGYTLEQSHQEIKISRRTIWLWRTKVKNILAAARIDEVTYIG